MATQTKEELAIARRKKRADRTVMAEQERVANVIQEREHLAMYKSSLPKRLKEAETLAVQLGVSVDVALSETGPSVMFVYGAGYADKGYINETITYETKEWKLSSLEAELTAIKAVFDSCNARREIAQSVFNNLSDEEKMCIKEHISCLR